MLRAVQRAFLYAASAFWSSSMVVAPLTEDNADRISVFKITRLMLPGCALHSPIVSMFPSKSAFVRTVTTCAIGVSPGSMLFIHSRLRTLLRYRKERTFALSSGLRESAVQTPFDVGLACNVAKKNGRLRSRLPLKIACVFSHNAFDEAWGGSLN